MSISENECLISLKRYWGYDELREHQYEICQAVLAGRDVFVLMATGSGKSLSYQLPPVLLRDRNICAWSLVICPLISLAEDQVAELNAIGISAALVGGSKPLDVESRVLAGEVCVVYITPEKLQHWTRELTGLAERRYLACIAVDEAHCVSEWGHDFRPAYRSLQDVRDSHFPHTPLLALTATATHAVMADISTALRLRSPLVVRTSFNRPNLFYAVKQRFCDNDIAMFVKKYYSEVLASASSPVPSVLIYVNTQNDAEKYARMLQEALAGVLSCQGVVVRHYHAGMSSAARTCTHQGFCHDAVHVIVATVAFGMGINKPDVRLIVHSEMPHSVEAYYQQTGRAGRDGFPSKCVLFYHRNDVVKLHSIQNYRAKSAAATNASTDKLTCMSNYCSSNSAVISCRRSFLLSYFDDHASSPYNSIGARCCDLCQALDVQAETAAAAAFSAGPNGVNEAWVSSSRSGSPEQAQLMGGGSGRVDLGHEVLLFLRAVQECGGYFGLSAAVGLVTGSKDKSLQKIPGYPDRLQTHGLGKRHPKAWWTELGHAMVEEGLLATEIARGGGFSYQRFMVGAAGKQHLLHHRAVPVSSLMNLQVAREAAAGGAHASRAAGMTSATVPGICSLEASKAFRIQLQFSPPFSSAVKVAAAATMSKKVGNGAAVQRQRTSTASSALAAFKSGHHLDDSIGALSAAHSQGGADSTQCSSLYDSETIAQLECRLRQTRGDLGEAMNLRPYNILSTEDLKNLAQYRPIDVTELPKIPGWGLQKIQNFGLKFVSCIAVFMRDMGLPEESNLPPPAEKETEKECDELPFVEEDVLSSPAASASIQLVAEARTNIPSRHDTNNDRTRSHPQIKCEERGGMNSLDEPDEEAMWTVQNPFRQPPPSIPISTSMASEYKCTMTESGSDASAPSAEPYVSFGPVKVALHTSALPDVNGSSSCAPQPHGAEIVQLQVHRNEELPAHPVRSLSLTSPPQASSALLKRKRSQQMPGLPLSRGTGSTKLKKTSSLPTAALMPSSSPLHTQLQGESSKKHLTAVIPESATVAGEQGQSPPSACQLEALVLQFLTRHPRQSFTEVLSGVLLEMEAGRGSEIDMHVRLRYAPLFREAITSLSNDFCIYLDGDKYCAL